MSILYSQYNFANGEISPSFFGRSDIPVYKQAVANATNVYITEAGGLRKRPGLQALGDGALAIKMIPFILTDDSELLIEISPIQIRVLKPNERNPDIAMEVLTTIIAPYLSGNISNIKYAQDGNTLFLTHNGYIPKKLTRTPVVNDVDTWDLADDTVTGWETLNNFPSVVSFYKQRKIFASSINNPRRLGMSAIADFTDFAVGTDPDSAIQINLASDTDDTIVAILPFETFIIFTKKGVWVNNNPQDLTPLNVSFVKRSNIGVSSRVSPIVLKNKILYVPSAEDDLLLLEFSFETSQYASHSITRTARHLFERRKIIYTATSDVNDIVLLVFEAEAGNCTGRETVCMRYNPDSGLQGFTVWDTNATISAIVPDARGTGFFYANTRDSESKIEHMDFEGFVYTDPGATMYVVGIETLPFENEELLLSDLCNVSTGYLKLLNTGPFHVKTTGAYIPSATGEEPFTGVCECPGLNSGSLRGAKFFLTTKNAMGFELLSYNCIGVSHSKNKRRRRDE